ncbi:MAG: sugar ABC transporter permease [Spirochaetes bacterium RIFOXYC1_FULL_54_7]|nr:MAG: sugar ABC transporter permease [Spirochaetes bacterium RIFOXYC1_FULL_54_7]
MSRKTSLPARVVIYTVLVLGSLIMFVPVFWIALSSFKGLGEIYLSPATFFPKKWIFSNYSEAISQFPFLRYLWNSIFVTTTATILTLFINSLAAFALSKYKFPGRDFIFILMLATLMVPVRVIMLPVYMMIARLGMANTLAGIIIPPSATPTGVFILRQYMLTIPDELIDAAKIDGAGHFQIYSRIIMPLSTPALAVLTVFSVMWRWNDFLWPLIVINREKLFTLQLALARFRGELVTDWNYVLAMTVLSILPIAFVFVFMQRYLVRGIASTGLKG